MSLEDQTAGLLETVKNPGMACGQYAEMLALYRRQDLDGLFEMITADESMESELDGLLYQRNKNWISPLEKMMKKESLFIAVGAAHLPGPEGVINLLRKKGYKVRAIE